MRVLIAGGGTGGHLFPGVAIAEELRARDPAAAVQFVGTARGLEARVLPELGWDLALIQVSGLKTVGVARRAARPGAVAAGAVAGAAHRQAVPPRRGDRRRRLRLGAGGADGAARAACPPRSASRTRSPA
jgi:cysteine synthase